MARYDFGGTLADFVVTSHRLGTLDTLALSAATLTLWDSQTGGNRYTDLVLNGSAVTSIAVGPDGQVPKFQGPDAVTEMWADGGSTRIRIVTLQGAPGPKGDPGPASTAPGPKGDPGTPGVAGITSVTLDDEVFGITDAANRKSWLAIAADGGPPDRVKAILSAVAQAGLGFTVTKANVLGRAYNITDANGREAFWIDEFGAIGFNKVTSDTAVRLVASLSSAGFDLVPQKYRDAQLTDHKIASGLNVVCWGDSLTIGSGNATLPASGVVTTATTYPQRLQALLTARLGFGVSTVYNAGIAGESAVTITARANATPLRLTPTGGSIPASGAVTVTLSNINGQTPAPLLSGGETDGVLWVNGVPVPGAISLSGSTYSFTRTTAGTSIPVGSPAAFAYTFAEAHRDDIAIIAIGQNGPTHPRPLYDAKAIISQMKALDKRYLIVNRPTSTDAEDSAYHDEFGRRFFDLRKYMIGYGLSDAGITPTAQDTADIANGVVPTSLRVDAIHFNAAGYWVWGNKIFNRLVELGWV